jgi:hypothetical protein
MLYNVWINEILSLGKQCMNKYKDKSDSRQMLGLFNFDPSALQSFHYSLNLTCRLARLDLTAAATAFYLIVCGTDWKLRLTSGIRNRRHVLSVAFSMRISHTSAVEMAFAFVYCAEQQAREPLIGLHYGIFIRWQRGHFKVDAAHLLNGHSILGMRWNNSAHL